ncbi:probable peptidyl-tRNA hydrolase 2 [Diadema antillarum]|uniref:probable peptidyl-tRNA hydrolase 2 n=1 Tax=Diadema antillarum TaxID=105358 RepID=UPI003A8C61C3
MAALPDDNPGGVLAEEGNAPCEAFVEMLMMMGIDRKLAEKAVQTTGNISAEAAVSWVFENADMSKGSILTENAQEFDNVKMVFAVNTALKMGVGKVAAQVGHACLDLHRILVREQEQYGDLLVQWEAFGEGKIVLNGGSKERLEELQAQAVSLGLPSYLVQDAGHTQIPAGSCTVLAIFGLASKVDQVTGQLKLL